MAHLYKWQLAVDLMAVEVIEIVLSIAAFDSRTKYRFGGLLSIPSVEAPSLASERGIWGTKGAFGRGKTRAPKAEIAF